MTKFSIEYLNFLDPYSLNTLTLDFNLIALNFKLAILPWEKGKIHIMDIQYLICKESTILKFKNKSNQIKKSHFTKVISIQGAQNFQREREKERYIHLKFSFFILKTLSNYGKNKYIIHFNKYPTLTFLYFR